MGASERALLSSPGGRREIPPCIKRGAKGRTALAPANLRSPKGANTMRPRRGNG